jgi:hypothetical protein
MIAWTIVRNLIFMDPDRVVHEILEILMLGNTNEGGDQQIVKELNMKCFNSKKTEFDEIELELQSKHKSCLINNFEEIDANLSVNELACKIECPREAIGKVSKLKRDAGSTERRQGSPRAFDV